MDVEIIRHRSVTYSMYRYHSNTMCKVLVSFCQYVTILSAKLCLMSSLLTCFPDNLLLLLLSQLHFSTHAPVSQLASPLCYQSFCWFKILSLCHCLFLTVFSSQELFALVSSVVFFVIQAGKYTKVDTHIVYTLQQGHGKV